MTLFSKTWTKGHWTQDDLWSQVFEVTCETLPKDHCNQVPWKFIKVCGYSEPFLKNLNQRSLTLRWPLTPHLLRSHVWLYPRIIVSKSNGNTSMFVDIVINFAKNTTYYIHTHTTYRMSDHIVSFWTQFRRVSFWTQFRWDKKETRAGNSFDNNSPKNYSKNKVGLSSTHPLPRVWAACNLACPKKIKETHTAPIITIHKTITQKSLSWTKLHHTLSLSSM